MGIDYRSACRLQGYVLKKKGQESKKQVKKKRINCRPQIRSRRFNPDEIDLMRVAEITAQMSDGDYYIPAEKVADAILEEADLLGRALLN